MEEELSTKKNITIELSPEVAASLRGERRKPNVVVASDGDDWNEEIPIVPPAFSSTATLPTAVVDDQASEITSEEEELSFSSPPTMPLIRLDLQRLVGYQPANEAEAVEVAAPIQQSLWGNQDEGYLGLDERVGELLESGAACHVTSDHTSFEEAFRYATIEYPPLLPHWKSSGEFELLDTERVWKRLLQPHAVDVVNQLLGLLRDCGRPLTWKHDMHEEIRWLARMEARRKRHQQRRWELYVWKQSRRKTQLEQLYNVQERLEERMQTALEQSNELLNKRDAQVRAALDERFGGDENDMYNNCLDKGESLAELFGVTDDDADDGSCLLSDRESLQDASVTSTESNMAPVNEYSSPDHDKNREREELALRERLTSPELRLSLALRDSLKTKLAQIDSLLESLQEEEWEDEEEGVVRPEHVDTKDKSRDKPSLLDQILAMILGSIPPPMDVSSEEHMGWQKEQHRSIVADWFAHFGRLPDPLLEQVADDQASRQESELEKHAVAQNQVILTKKADLRESLGLDEVVENWDEESLVDECGRCSERQSSSVPTPPPKVGLRPGGTV